jgi:hypothetical protein
MDLDTFCFTEFGDGGVPELFFFIIIFLCLTAPGLFETGLDHENRLNERGII